MTVVSDRPYLWAYPGPGGDFRFALRTGIRVQVETPAPPVSIPWMGHLERKRLSVDSAVLSREPLSVSV